MLQKNNKKIVTLLFLITTIIINNLSVKASNEIGIVENEKEETIPVSLDIPSTYTVYLPQTIAIQEKGYAKYNVSASGNIKTTECLSITPVTDQITFKLMSNNNYILSGYVTQDDSIFDQNDLFQNNIIEGEVGIDNFWSGSYQSSIDFNIKLFDIDNPKTTNKSLWSWDESVITNDIETDQLIDFCNTYGIDRIYQCFTTSPEIPQTLDRFIKKCHASDIKVFYGNGDPAFANDIDNVIANTINPIITYNNNHTEKLDGICLDDEVYLNSDWEENKEIWQKKDVLLSKTIYEVCQQNNLTYVLCTHPNNVENNLPLIDNCDELSLMTYNNGQQAIQIKSLYAITKEKGVPIEIITEFESNNSTHSRTSLNKAISEWMYVQEIYNDDSIRLSLYWYEFFQKNM